MQTRHTHFFVHQRTATDNGIIHLSHTKASAALDSFDNIYPLLVSEQHPLLYNTMVLSKPVRPVLPQIIHIVHASLIRRKRPLLCLGKYIINIYMKFKFLSIGGNTVMCNIWSTCLCTCTCPDNFCTPLSHFALVVSFCFKCHLTPLSNNVKPIYFVCFSYYICRFNRIL